MRTKLKKAGLWTVVISLLISVSVGTAVSATRTITVSSAKRMVEEAALAQLITQKLHMCLGSIATTFNPQNGADTISAAQARVGNIFMGHNALIDLNETNIETGSWLEYAIQGKVQDGEIWCTNGDGKIASLFVEYVGQEIDSSFTMEDLICDRDSTDSAGSRGPGILKKYGANAGNCNDFSSGIYVKADDAAGYLARLYNAYAATNPYAVRNFSDIGTYDKATGYYLYQNDFEIACGTGDYYNTDENLSHTNTFTSKVKIVNNRGEIVKQIAGAKSGMSDNSNSHSSFAENGPTTCGGLIDKMNTYATDYQAVILDAIRSKCGADDVKTEVAEVISQYEEMEANGATLTDEQSQALETLRNAQRNNDYTQPTPGGGLKCIETTLITVTEDPYIDPGDAAISAYTSKCLDSKAAESLGWLICPILSLASSATEWLYSEIIQPFLEVNPVLVNRDNNGTYGGWQVFQNFANIVAVILLLIIIFSQVTGFGIDNYGIKKLLPKFIVAMVLINLSFIICQAAVDVSNLAGKGSKDLFDSLGAAVSLDGKNLTIGGTSESMGKLGAAGVTAISGVALIGVVVAFIAIPGLAATFLPGILLALLGAVLSMLAAVLVLFALLTIRQIAVVVLVVISPLAIACYMLPNTKKLFDKWLSFFKNMLVMFPLCGVVIGGGNFVSRVLLSGNDINFPLALGSMLASVIPFFFIPTLLRGSMNVLGNIGTRLGNLGRGLTNTATGAARNSETMKRVRAQLGSGMNSRGELTRFGRLRTAVARRTGLGARGVARAQAAVAKQHEEDAAASATMRSTLNDRLERVDPKHFTEDTVRDQLIDAMASGDRERAMSILTDANGRFKAKDVAKMFRTAASDARVTGNARGLDKNRDFLAAASRISALSKDVYLKQWAESRGRDTKTGAALSLAAFEAKLNSEPGQVKDGEISDMSSDALERAISGGLVTSAQSQRILADASNYAKMDDASRLIHAANQRGITITKADAGDILTGTSRHGITQADATEWIKPPASDVNVKSGSVSVSGGSVTVAGGTLNTVENVQVVHDVNRVVNVEDVQRVNTVQQVNNVQNVQRVQQVNGVVDVNIRDVNTKGNPQTQPLIVKHDNTPEPPKIILPPFN